MTPAIETSEARYPSQQKMLRMIMRDILVRSQILPLFLLYGMFCVLAVIPALFDGPQDMPFIAWLTPLYGTSLLLHDLRLGRPGALDACSTLPVARHLLARMIVFRSAAISIGLSLLSYAPYIYWSQLDQFPPLLFVVFVVTALSASLGFPLLRTWLNRYASPFLSDGARLTLSTLWLVPVLYLIMPLMTRANVLRNPDANDVSATSLGPVGLLFFLTALALVVIAFLRPEDVVYGTPVRSETGSRNARRVLHATEQRSVWPVLRRGAALPIGRDKWFLVAAGCGFAYLATTYPTSWPALLLTGLAAFFVYVGVALAELPNLRALRSLPLSTRALSTALLLKPLGFVTVFAGVIGAAMAWHHSAMTGSPFFLALLLGTGIAHLFVFLSEYLIESEQVAALTVFLLVCAAGAPVILFALLSAQELKFLPTWLQVIVFACCLIPACQRMLEALVSGSSYAYRDRDRDEDGWDQ